jgi:hypothetical protein
MDEAQLEIEDVAVGVCVHSIQPELTLKCTCVR